MNTLGSKLDSTFGKGSSLRDLGVPILLVTGFLSLRWLFNSNMGLFNEANMLPFARQHIDTSWIAQDWYMNQPPGYRVPFIQVFGRMATAWGFLATSIVGRLLCYTWIASALVFLGRRLRLSLPLLLLALTLFLYVNTGTSGAAGAQGAAAREWLVGGVEPKMVAYGLILYAIAFLLTERLLGAALLLGLATSFHTLVGGWAFMASIGWLMLWRRSWLLSQWRRSLLFLAIYAIAGWFAILPILQQVTADAPVSRFSPSFVYVYLRTPHHLNPLAWEAGWWVKPIVLLLVLGGSVLVLRRQAIQSEQLADSTYQVRLGLATFTLVSLIPFALGLLIAPFDREGKILQYYLFRFGDLMLPLNTCLLVSCALEQTFATGKARLWLNRICIGLISLVCVLQAVAFTEQALALQQFPGEAQEVESTDREMLTWIRDNTPQEALFVTPPVDLATFTWLAERATIAKFKLVPPTAEGIPVWIDRLTDLSGDVDPWTKISRTQDNSDRISRKLTQGYNQLTTQQATDLMRRYQATYFLGNADHALTLPIIHRNEDYILYSQPHS